MSRWDNENERMPLEELGSGPIDFPHKSRTSLKGLRAPKTRLRIICEADRLPDGHSLRSSTKRICFA